MAESEGEVVESAIVREMERNEHLMDSIEALLFVAVAPVPLPDLVEAIGAEAEEIHEALEQLKSRLDDRGGIRLAKIAGGYQLSTKPDYAQVVANLLKPQRKRLGRSSLEVLAIIAYRQPVTAQELFVIRGVQSDYSLRVLMDLGLIQELERMQAPGRPILYGTTQQFLHQFNLSDLSELPKIGGGEAT